MKVLEMGPWPVVHVVLLTSPRQVPECEKHFGIAVSKFPGPGCGSTSWHPATSTELPVIVIAIPRAGDPVTLAGVAVHEAVHVWQYIAEYINAGNTGKEIPAYSIQWVAKWIIEEMRLCRTTLRR